MRVSVLLFAALRESAGREQLEVELGDGGTVGDLRRRIEGEWPALARIPYVVAVNRDYAGEEQELTEGDEVALVPVISGGEGGRFEFLLSHHAIDVRGLEKQVRSDDDGAIVTFLGVTRSRHEGRVVRRLAYEAYEEMVIAKGLAILEEAAAGLEVGRIWVQHRLGEVPVGETSVAVVVAAPHREPAFKAARAVMDRVKREVPIFKKEFYADEGAAWIGDLPEGG